MGGVYYDPYYKYGDLEEAMDKVSKILENDPLIDVEFKLANDFFRELAASEICITGAISNINADFDIVTIQNLGYEVEVWVDSVYDLSVGEVIIVIGSLDVVGGSNIDIRFSISNGTIVNKSQIPTNPSLPAPGGDLEKMMTWFIDYIPPIYHVGDLPLFNRFVAAIKNADIKVSGTITEVISDGFYRIKCDGFEMHIFTDYTEDATFKVGEKVTLKGRLLSISDYSGLDSCFVLTDCFVA